MQSLKNGAQLGGYTLIRLIARGGMGEVYEAHENRLQRRVALKVIAPSNPDEHDRDDLVRRFMIEARTLARVNHPNIVTIYSIDSNAGAPFIAMEYVDGVSFRQLLEEFTFTIDGGAPLFEQMLEGLKCLHDNKIIHRDLKPHNILLRPDGQVKILDFGIAKNVGTDENTRVGVIVGTLPYMAPELKMGANANTRSDIWSMGAIFYECLTGRRLVDSVKDGAIHYPEEVAGKIPVQMCEIIAKMCHPDAGMRYANVPEVIQDLRLFRSTRPPVPAAVWSTLAQKVEALAEAERAEREKKAPSVRLPTLEIEDSNQGLIAQQNLPPQRPSAQDPMTGILRTNSANRRKRKQIEDRNRLILLASGGLAALAIVGLFLGGGQGPHLPIKFNPTFPLPAPLPTPTPSLVPSPTPMSLSTSTAGETAESGGHETPPSENIAPHPAESLPLVLTEPTNTQVQWLEPTRIPTFSWSKHLNNNEYDIQIAQDAKFKHLVVQEPINGNSFRPGRVLPEGTYYWRLYPHKAASPPIGPQSFTLGTLAPVTLVSPENGAMLNTTSKIRNQVDFSWNCKPGAKLYVIEVDSHQDFSGQGKKSIVGNCSWNYNGFGVGTFFWRVRISDVPGTTDLWSAVRQFTIRLPSSPFRPSDQRISKSSEQTPPSRRERRKISANANGDLAKPKLHNPKQTVTLVFKKVPRGLASLGNSVQTVPTLRWNAVKNAHHYHLEISPTKTFDQLLLDKEVSGTHYEWKGVIPGHVYWRVSASNRSGEDGDESEFGQVTTLLPAPMLNSSYSLSVPAGAGEQNPGSGVVVDWNAIPLATQYLVQVGPRRELAAAESKLTPQDKISLVLKPGTYYMRVAAADEAGEAISGFSNISTLNVKAEPSIQAPQLISPKPGARAPGRGGVTVVFKWSEVTNASGYLLEIARDPEFKDLLDRRSPKTHGLVLQRAPFTDRVYWRVQSVGPQGESNWSEVRYFDVKNGDQSRLPAAGGSE